MGAESNFLNLEKNMDKIPAANVILSGERLNASLLGEEQHEESFLNSLI